MKYRAKVVADSIGPNRVRLTTLEFDIWKPLLAEFNTHGLLSRNFPSSRAIPWPKMREKIIKDPHIPIFRKNSPGMQPGETLNELEQEKAAKLWLAMRDETLNTVENLGIKEGLNIHKQWLNRPLESWITVTGLVTATHWDNFWNLRTELNDSCYPMAQDELYFMTLAMKKAIDESTPRELHPNDWHLPYNWDTSLPGCTCFGDYNDAMVSAGRCATVSYDNLGKGIDANADLKRATDVLLPFGHMSVFQHQARCMEERYGGDKGLPVKWKRNGFVEMSAFENIEVARINTNQCWWGQLCGWGQFRKSLENEQCWVSPNSNRELALTLPELITE